VLILHVEGQPFVQAVRLDDPSPGYAEKYAGIVKRYLDPDAVLRWVEVDVSSVAEYGPNDIAAMLSEDTQADEGLMTDLPQRWEVA
jgi:hypothetical protein